MYSIYITTGFGFAPFYNTRAVPNVERVAHQHRNDMVIRCSVVTVTVALSSVPSGLPCPIGSAHADETLLPLIIMARVGNEGPEFAAAVTCCFPDAFPDHYILALNAQMTYVRKPRIY